MRLCVYVFASTSFEPNPDLQHTFRKYNNNYQQTVTQECIPLSRTNLPKHAVSLVNVSLKNLSLLVDVQTGAMLQSIGAGVLCKQQTLLCS